MSGTSSPLRLRRSTTRRWPSWRRLMGSSSLGFSNRMACSCARPKTTDAPPVPAATRRVARLRTRPGPPSRAITVTVTPPRPARTTSRVPYTPPTPCTGHSTFGPGCRPRAPATSPHTHDHSHRRRPVAHRHPRCRPHPVTVEPWALCGRSFRTRRTAPRPRCVPMSRDPTRWPSPHARVRTPAPCSAKSLPRLYGRPVAGTVHTTANAAPCRLPEAFAVTPGELAYQHVGGR